MNPNVIVVYECVLAQYADVLHQLSSRASDLHAVGSGFNFLSDSFFVSEWKPFFIFIRLRVRAAYLSSVVVITKKKYL